ncbi:MAG: aminotransferase class III-fold pyridoxal phosphate-dependent enzyme, partial [Bdellovibrionia bacterium]
ELKNTIFEFLNSNRGINTQGSVKPVSRRLAVKLSELAGGDYRCILTNSGAETVEAAIKHAELYRTSKIKIIAERHERALALLSRNRSRTEVQVTERAAQVLGLTAGLHSLAELGRRLRELNSETLDRGPAFLALKGGFHGKTSGALKLTYNSEYKKGLDHLGPVTVFIDPANPELLNAMWSAQFAPYYEPLDLDGVLDLEERRTERWAAIIAEPIQGEGGIRPVSQELLQRLRSLATEFDVPLIMDEIQTGLGRTGEFLATRAAGVEPDYILLSKSLGGGIMKIGALLIRKAVYIPEFSLIQTSTFAEDELSSAVSEKTLDLLFGAESSAMENVVAAGAKLMTRLLELRARYPNVIADVRGRGLMIGIELESWHLCAADTMRMISDSRQVAPIVAGHLLNVERIRVLPTLSDPWTVRLEPSLFLKDADIDWFMTSFENLCKVIAARDEAKLLAFMLLKERDGFTSKPKTKTRLSPFEEPLPGAFKVGFLAHFAKYTMIKDHLPELARLSPSECKEFFDRYAKGRPGPWLLGSKNVRLRSGKVVHFTCIGLLTTSEQFKDAIKNGERHRAIELINDGIDMAVGLGCKTLGLGMLTSVVTRNGLDLVRDDICITTGNSLTAALGVDAVLEQLNRRTGEDLTIAAIGAAGNICRMYVQLLAPRFSKAILVGSGKPGSERKLAEIGATLNLRRPLARQRRPSELEAPLFARSEIPRSDQIIVTNDVAALKDADVVISATNDPEYLIFPHHLKASALVCDLSFPHNVSPEVNKARPDVLVINGGVAETPFRENLELAYFPLNGERVYACMAETMLLGSVGEREHFSYGDLEREKVERIRALFYEEGFKLVTDKGWHDDPHGH